MIDEDVRLREELEQVAVPSADLVGIVDRGRQLHGRWRAVMIAGAAVTALIVAIGAVSAVSALRVGEPGRLLPASGEEGTSHLAAYLDQDATEAEVQNLFEAAGNMEGVISMEYISKAQAFAEFKERYRDEPQLWENLREGALPASVRLTLKADADADAIRRQLLVQPGVDQVAP